MSTLWRQVDSSGLVTISGYRTADGTEVALDLLDGVGLEDASLATRRATVQVHPIGQRSPTRRAVGIEFRITANRALEDADTLANGQRAHSFMALTAPAVRGLMATYRNANGTTLFQGWCQWEQAEDTQRAADFARQSVVLVSDGDPLVPDLG